MALSRPQRTQIADGNPIVPQTDEERDGCAGQRREGQLVVTTCSQPNAPHEQLPQELRDRLVVMNEVVEASGTQIVEIRQNGGERSEEFSVEGRMNAGTLMVAFGDTDASLLRQTAWARDGRGGWKFSAVTEDAATRHGLSREDFERMVDDLGGVLPSVDSPAVVGARTIDQEAHCLARGSWISYSSLSSLLRGH